MVVVKFTAQLAAYPPAVDPPWSLPCDKFPLTSFAIATTDYVDGKPLRRKYSQRYEIPAAVLEKVRIAMTRLHKGRFVFGDLRWPNVLATKVEGDNYVELVNLGWYGKEGEGEYLSDVDLVDARWQVPSGPCGLSTKRRR